MCVCMCMYVCVCIFVCKVCVYVMDAIIFPFRSQDFLSYSSQPFYLSSSISSLSLSCVAPHSFFSPTGGSWWPYVVILINITYHELPTGFQHIILSPIVMM